jgi:hypothetical protein
VYCAWRFPNRLSYYPAMHSAAAQQNDGRQEFLKDFHQTIENASPRLHEISEADSRVPRSEGKWSPKEIIGHLIDSAANNHQRFVRAQFSDELVFPGYEQEQWIQAQHYQDEPWTALLQLWQFYNQHLLHVITRAPEETRTKLRHKHNLHKIASDAISESEPVTLEFFMRDYLDHMKKHLKQILG